MAKNFKTPPTFNSDTPYEIWVKEIKLWAICSKVDKKEQAPAVALSLSGNARNAALEIDIEELNTLNLMDCS